MSPPSPDTWAFDRCADHLALDFANTISDRFSEAPIDRIPSYPELVEFGRQCALLGDRQAAALVSWAAGHRQQAAAIERRAISLREALHRIFDAVAADRAPDQGDLDVLDRERQRLRLETDLGWHWRAGADAPDALFGPIVTAALELLLSDQRQRVRHCEADTCRWLFLDLSKNHSRRWCDMKQCGNRAKARRFAARQRDRRHGEL